MNDTRKYLSKAYNVAENSMLVIYREIGDFITSTIISKEVSAGIKGWFGKLNYNAAPTGYKGEEYAIAFEFDRKKFNIDQAYHWVKESNYKADTVGLKGVEIMHVGEWNGDTYSKKDFESMIDAFESGVYVPGFKLGHNKTQKALMEFLDGMPRFGNLKKLYIDGEILRGDWEDVPRRLATVLEANAFRDRSAEIKWNLKRNGKIWPKVLTALVFSGDFIPAVENLEDTISLYETEKAAKALDNGETKLYNLTQEGQEVQKNLMKHSKAWHRCVEKVSARGDVTSPEAVCTWSTERTGNTYMKENGQEPVGKNLKMLMISLDELKMLDPTFANELEVAGFAGISIDLEKDYEITKLKIEEVKNKMTMTPDEQKQLEAALKAKDEAEAKLKKEEEAKIAILKEKEAKEAELKGIREKEAEAGILSKVESLLKTKIKSEAVDAFVTIYKALAAKEKVSCYSLKEGKIVKGEEAVTLEMFLKFVDAIPENPEVVKLFKEQATKTGQTAVGADEGDEFMSKVNAYLKENKLEKTVENLKKAADAVYESEKK